MSKKNIFNDISSIYIGEVLKPQLGKDSVTKKEGGEGEDSSSGAGDDGSAKRIRQAVYDIRYRARREDIPVDQAFNQYMSHTSMSAVEKSSVKEKLGIGAGAPVKEDAKPGEHYLRVVPKRGTGEKAYTRKFDPSSEKDRSKRHKLEARGIKTYVTKHGTPYDASKDQDGDNDNDFADVMSARMQASGMSKDAANKKVAKKPYNKGKQETQKESFSNWRNDLFEIIDTELETEKKQEIKENPKINNKVVINPKLDETIKNLGGELISEEDITEEFLMEEVEVASEYFYEQGLNEYGVDILIEKLGIEEFVNFVQDISEEYVLLEWRRGAGGTKVRGSQLSKGGKHISTLKGGAKTSAIKGTAEHKARKAEKEKTDDKPSGMTSALKSQSEKAKARRIAVKTAKVKQPETKSTPKKTKKGILDRVAGAVLKGMERHQKATAAAKQSFERGMQRHKAATSTATKVAKVGARAATEIGKGIASGAKETVTAAKKVKKAVVGEETELQEKITAKTDMGTAIKDFYASKSPQLAGRTKKERRDAAIAAVLTARRGGKKLGEALAPVQSGSVPKKNNMQQKQQDTQDMQQKHARNDLEAQKQKRVNAQAKANKLRALQQQMNVIRQTPTGSAVPVTNSYQPEGESIEELNRYAKETGKSFRTGRPTSSGGTMGGSDPKSQALRSVMKSMGSNRAGVNPRGKKKVPGQKPPAAGQYGSERRSPEQIVKNRRAQRQAAQDMMHSRFD